MKPRAAKLATRRFAAAPAAARRAIVGVMREIGAAGLSGERLGDVEIALAEAVNNVIEHAYDAQAGGRVRVESDLSPERLRIAISDSGRGFAGGAPPAPRLPDPALPRESLPEGGFGWTLIRALADEVDYTRTREGNRLTLTFRLGRRPDRHPR